MNNDTTPKYCLNCQTELQGKFCHECGQVATNKMPTILKFILQYMDIAFIWDTHFIKTFRKLICRPGFLTKEYISGKFVSYTHPLKLNMFLLFVFITIFLLSPHAENLNNSLQSVTRNEVMSPLILIQLMADDPEYSMKMESSSRDTVQLHSPLLLFESFPELFDNIDRTTHTSTDTIGVWTAAIPHILIEDKVIIHDDQGHYRFNLEDKYELTGINLLENIWDQMYTLATKYFLIIILLTVPFLSMVVSLIQRKGKHPKLKHFIFSLHYTAFLESLIILIYLIHLIASPPSWVMQSIMVSVSFTYLTIAIRKVYETERWYRAFMQALFTNVGYTLILMILFVIVFLISIFIVANQA